MRLTSASIIHFRNFAYVEQIVFPPQNILVAAAPNATGKTNFVESIYMLLRGKSFRGPTEECIQWGQEGFLLQAEIEAQHGSTHIAVRYHAPSRKLRIEENSEPASLVTFYSSYPLVVFEPEDTFLFFRGPAQRRNFLNQVLASAPSYLSALVQYQRVLRQRNAALKSATSFEDVRVWSDLLAEHAKAVWAQRLVFVAFLQTHLPGTYKTLTGEELSFRVKFVPGASDPTSFPDLLRAAWEQERLYAYTLLGPHRDDVDIITADRPVRAVLSQGQMRGLVIALKFIAHQYLEQITRQTPILLLDEVLSELDDAHQTRLLEHLPDAQVLLTCTTVPKTLQEEGAHLLDLRSILSDHTPEPVGERRVAVSAVP